MNLFSPLSPEALHSINTLTKRVEALFPIPARFQGKLLRTVADLSQLFTAHRPVRTCIYLNDPPKLSAYLRYFLPWNVYRLCRLLPSLPLTLQDGDALTDLGSGPLTFPLALWIARPDLRTKHLEFRCLDRAGAALEAGKKLFSSLLDCPHWHIKTIRASLSAPVHGPKAALITASMVLNEEYESPHTALAGIAERAAHLLTARTTPDGMVLVVEPGIPRSGKLISALRTALHTAGFPCLSPCPHTSTCPCPDSPDAKWCHFAFSTDDAPPALLNLSAAAGIPKERATLSFLLAGSTGSCTKGLRIVSDAFPIDRADHAQYGRYACSERGLVLLTGKKAAIKAYDSGTLLPLPDRAPQKRDQKTGAFIVEVRP
ncbi:MAG: small ribosomal subunit Rsm22 family protein [Spirochaetaceae bacterium]|nr:small ribosomal subunit Rsm22 family protein [Spirochaetaceae bacterium]